MKYIGWIWRNSRGIRWSMLARILAGTAQVAAGLLMVWLSRRFIDETIMSGTARDVTVMILWLVLTVVLRVAFRQLSYLLTTMAGVKLTNGLRLRMYSSLFRRQLYTGKDMHSGDVSYRLTKDITEVSDTLTDVIPQILITLIQLTGAFFLLRYFDRWLAWALIILTPAAIFLTKLAGRKIVVRAARAGETMKTLDGQERKLDEKMLLICDAENPEALKPIAIDEPTMSMTFCINDSPFFGQDGKYVTSRHIQDRLNKELEKNLALRVEKGTEESSWRVYGRGVLHLSVLIETMRREGYELQVGQPQVIIKEINGQKCEPVESLTVNTPEECSGKIIEFVSTHKGEMTKMEMVNDRVHLEFTIPSRGIMGMRTYVMNVSAGEAIMAHRFLVKDISTAER